MLHFTSLIQMSRTITQAVMVKKKKDLQYTKQVFISDSRALWHSSSAISISLAIASGSLVQKKNDPAQDLCHTVQVRAQQRLFYNKSLNGYPENGGALQVNFVIQPHLEEDRES